MLLEFRKLQVEAVLPTRKYPGDAGLDLYTIETVTIAPQSQVIIHTGIGLNAAPPNCVLQVWPKSGIDAKQALHTGAGIIDTGYRGEILVLLKNMGQQEVSIPAQTPVAQLVVLPCLFPDVVETKLATKTKRNTHGGIVGETNNEIYKTR